MRITVHTDSGPLPLAGDAGVSEREFSSVAGFEIRAATDVQVIRKVRAEHAIPVDRDNLVTTLDFQTRRMFPTHGEAVAWASDAEEMEPLEGVLIFPFGNGRDRGLVDAVVSPPRASVQGCQVTLSYQAQGGRIVWILPEDLGGAEVLHRVNDDGDEKWFEVGFLSPRNDLVGNEVDGWTDPGGVFLLRFFRSEDLATWDHDFIPAPGSPEAQGDDWIYWARCKYPVDSKVKSGAIRIESYGSGASPNTLGAFQGDTRNNPLTELTVAGVSLALGGFPYTMPTDAARMQTDLRVFYPTATVTATTDVDWVIQIPTVNLTVYTQYSRVSWPGYLVADFFGNLTITVDGVGFAGDFINAAGVRTQVRKQFARLAVSAGPNYPH